jgi:hypothetical protein
VNQARILGGTIGLACSTIILDIKINKSLSGVLSPTELDTLRQTVTEISSLKPDQQLAVKNTFAHAFDDQMRICTYVSIASVLASLLVFSRYPINFKKRMELAEEVLYGRISPDDADKLLRAR